MRCEESGGWRGVLVYLGWDWEIIINIEEGEMRASLAAVWRLLNVVVQIEIKGISGRRFSAVW